MRTRLFRTLFVLITTIVLICIPQASFAGPGHGGGGGGFHGGGGGFGGGFHGGGTAFHGAAGWSGGRAGWGWGGGWGWHGGWGWPAGWGWRGWGYPGWGWGFGVSIGWGGYWPAYPYAYAYPYYYPYYPYYPYPNYGPYGYPPPDPGRSNQSPQNRDDDPQRQNSDDYAPPRFSRPDVVTIKAPTATPVSSYRTVAAIRTVPGQRVENVIRALEAMPPEARRRQIESGRYSNLTPAEQELVRRVAGTSNIATRASDN